MENRSDDFSHIKGWGVDADPENEPTYPIKKYSGDDHDRLNWQRPPQQPVTVEVLHSNERPNLPAVFGTSVPLSGLSGMLRRYAFQFSESSYGHWLTLLLADRINVVEGIIEDLKQGHVPNIFAEKGWKADWKYNRPAPVKRVLVTAIVTTALVAYFNRKKKRRR